MLREMTIAAAVLAGAMGLMQLRTSDFSAGGPMPRPLMAAECGGQNRSPALTWAQSPQRAKSFALIMHDADAPIPGGFYHWVVYDLPAQTKTLGGNARLPKSELGTTSAGQRGYYGPCPPSGPAHHYTITLYALDVAKIANGAVLTGPQVERRVVGHVLGRAALLGTASRP
jgi:Raf kinase inhibitor-like YbhB/YbcL family protein